jgi:plasmid stabilization system protein ParE
MSYVFTPLAKSDLEEIWCFIAEDDPKAADQLEADIYAACQLLTTQPEMGNRRPAWSNKPVRFWPVRKNYLIVYVPESDPMEILRIFNTARDIPKLLNE